MFNRLIKLFLFYLTMFDLIIDLILSSMQFCLIPIVSATITYALSSNISSPTFECDKYLEFCNDPNKLYLKPT